MSSYVKRSPVLFVMHQHINNAAIYQFLMLTLHTCAHIKPKFYLILAAKQNIFLYVAYR